MRLLRRAGYRRMAWKNGQGVTEEVAVSPAGADAGGFDWRASIAHVGADGPFSLFPGIDRTIALLDGAGLTLDLPDGSAQRLLPGGTPFSFPGEWAIFGRNAAGPTIDLNVMTRRGRCAHAMRRVFLAAGEAFAAPTGGLAVLGADAVLEAGAGRIAVAFLDTVALSGGERFASPDAPVSFVWTTIYAPHDMG